MGRRAQSWALTGGTMQGKHCVLVDDLIQTGGTLIQTGKVSSPFPRALRLPCYIMTLATPTLHASACGAKCAIALCPGPTDPVGQSYRLLTLCPGAQGQ